jgi:hypothetical protein
MNEESVYVNLKVIALIQPFQRINTRTTLFKLTPVENTNYATNFIPEFFTRWWTGATRETDFFRLKDLYMTTFDRLLDESNSNGKDRLLAHLRESKKGLINLQKTYMADDTIKSRLQNLLEQIDIVLE